MQFFLNFTLLFFSSFSVKKFIKYLLILCLFFGCEDLNDSRENHLIARVDNNYLYMSDLDYADIKYSSISDSIVKTKDYINKWAKKHLLYDRSLLNIDDKNVKRLNRLVDQYKLDLYINSYRSSIIKSQIDTLITENQLKEYYDKNNSIFLLKEPLYRYRFIEFPKSNIDRNEIVKRFVRYNSDDKIFLDSLSFQFSSSFLNDSIWYTKTNLLQNAKFLFHKDLISLKKSEIFEVDNSFQLSLLKIEDYMPKNEIAPLTFVENTIRNIVFNQRKLEFLKNFDKEIINDAIQNKKFETYK